MSSIEEILDFWFGDATESPEKAGGRMGLWFGSSLELDAEIRDRFGELFEAASRGELSHWQETAEGSMAFVILLDQFSRNIHRRTAEAFAADPLALAAAERAVESGQEAGMPPIWRSFLYLPFEHSESLEDQDRCVELMRRSAARASQEWRELLEGNVRYAEGHREIIARFGRFPHRNQVLGRVDTPEEAEHLKTAQRFGQ